MKFENREIKVVWVDLDDTIIDFLTNSRRALEWLWGAEPLLRRLFPSADEWIEVYEKHNHALWVAYSKGDVTRSYLRMERFRLPLIEGGASHGEATEASAMYDTLYLDRLAEENELIPGSLELLRFLREQHVMIGCLSNGFTDVQMRKIRNCGLDPWFDFVVLSDDIGVNKPDVRLFKYAMGKTGIENPIHHLMIGDNAATDIAGAVAAGWAALQFLRTPSSALSPDCGYHLESLSEMTDILRRHASVDLSECNR